MTKTDILFTGFYGQLNTGDDAFVEVASWGAEKYWNKFNNRFLALSSKLPKTITPVKGYPFNLAKTYNFQKRILLRNTSFLISAGGSTIHSKLTDTNPKKIALDLKKANHDIKIGAIGVSVGPFHSLEDEKEVNNYLRNIDFIALRDQRSFEYVSSLDLPYNPINAFDLAALLPEIYNLNPNNLKSRKVIGISVCPYESIIGGDVGNENRRNNKIIDLISKLDKLGDFEFKFFIINGNTRIGDMEITKKIISSSNPKNFEIYPYNNNTKVVWENINACDVMFSTRLHGAIFACFGKTPFMLVEYHKKCSDFLEDIGYDINARIFDCEFDVNLKAELIYNWCMNYNTYKVPKYLELKVHQSRLNFTEINF
ncbi:polysaccharide pyruvyl transferase family protein [Sphingobacterium cellulitidis]|uniref:polysaccharide pyruvyl transferase family protein n=1 Tax=Sphingobacterium cellulitidis TaxID=1768011 RepID=UPI00370D7211